jgi:hypothetical protein
MNQIEQMKARIENNKIRADDIRVDGLLTQKQIASIDSTLVYAWVKTGLWRKQHFDKWLKAVKGTKICQNEN